MSPAIWLLFLLGAAFLGSHWFADGQRRKGYGLSSGLEYLALGAVIGPEGLALVATNTLSAFEPVSLVGLGWLGLVFGMEQGALAGALHSRLGTLARYLVHALVTSLLVAAGYGLLRSAGSPDGRSSWLLSLALTLVVIQTASDDGAAGDGELRRTKLAASSGPVTFAGLALLLSVFARPHVILGHTLTPTLGFALCVALGTTVGVAANVLIEREPRQVGWWAVLLGAALLTSGACAHLDLSVMSALFAMGMTLARSSSKRAELHTLLASTERTVLLPILLLAGAHLTIPGWNDALLLAGCLAARIALGIVAGALLRDTRERATSSSWLGLGTLPPEHLLVPLAFSVVLAGDGSLGRLLLQLAAAELALGELAAMAVARPGGAPALMGHAKPLARPGASHGP